MIHLLIILKVSIHHIIVINDTWITAAMCIENQRFLIMNRQFARSYFIMFLHLYHELVELPVQQERTKLVVNRQTILEMMFNHPCRWFLHPFWRLPQHSLHGYAIRHHRLTSTYQRIGKETTAQFASFVETSYTEHRQRRICLERFFTYFQSFFILFFFHQMFHAHTFMKQPVIACYKVDKQYHHQHLKQIHPHIA